MLVFQCNIFVWLQVVEQQQIN